VEFKPIRNPRHDTLHGMTTVHIRTLTTDEWTILRDVRFASLRDAPEAFTSTVEHEEHYPPDVWQLRTGTSAVAFVDDAPVGIAGWFRPPDADHAELVGMWVDRAHRGTGVAIRLVEFVIASTAGDDLVLHVRPGNGRAQALYARAGFVPDGHDTDRAEGVTLLRMRHRGA
jgi:ribosomal protein S18 acetylase RimI-like enzyme